MRDEKFICFRKIFDLIKKYTAALQHCSSKAMNILLGSWENIITNIKYVHIVYKWASGKCLVSVHIHFGFRSNIMRKNKNRKEYEIKTKPTNKNIWQKRRI